MPSPRASTSTVVDGSAPSHGTGACRVLLSPAVVAGSDGPTRNAAVVVRRGRRDGTASRLYAGGALLAAVESVESALGRVDARAVWLTDRSYVREHWPPWTVRTAERRLADAADRENARLIAWTGDRPS